MENRFKDTEMFNNIITKLFNLGKEDMGFNIFKLGIEQSCSLHTIWKNETFFETGK